MAQEVQISADELNAIKTKIRRQISQLTGRRIVVVGDIGLDEYVMGEVRRISPEAPVPVVEVKSEDSRLGLAANVAQNVASLGGNAMLVSVIGADSAGEQLKQKLKSSGVNPEHLLVDQGRPTIRKLRVMAEHHHLVRVDYELKRYLDPAVEKKLLERLGDLIPKSDGVVIEDYAKGLLSESAMQSVIKLGQKHGKKVVVDPHRTTPVHFYAGVDLMTPNRDEAIALAGVDADDLRGSENLILELGRELRKKAKAEHMVITRGKEGMTLFDQEKVVHLPTYARQVFDVTGAGDTVIAALSLAWAAGWPLAEACVLANFAAGVVVGKVGCVPCRTDELLAYIDSLS
ncbi:MAG: D-glycero-beta-D-manno-heptose-7-phosphate kinase [Bdellovibrionales bacterium]